MSGSEWKGWPSKEDHDEVRDAYAKSYGLSIDQYALLPAMLPKALNSAGFCACCGTSGVRAQYQNDVDSIRIHGLGEGGVVDVLPGLDHIVIRDKDLGDRVITWRDA